MRGMRGGTHKWRRWKNVETEPSRGIKFQEKANAFSGQTRRVSTPTSTTEGMLEKRRRRGMGKRAKPEDSERQPLPYEMRPCPVGYRQNTLEIPRTSARS